jgi:hypothetical protein
MYVYEERIQNTMRYFRVDEPKVLGIDSGSIVNEEELYNLYFDCALDDGKDTTLKECIHHLTTDFDVEELTIEEILRMRL